MHYQNTLFVGTHIERFAQLGSTNTYALDLLSKSLPPEGTVITTDNQSDGRGQIGSKWESEAGQNLTLSIILYPNFLPIRQQFLLTQCISLGVREFTAKFIDNSVKVKWPNDIYINQNKVSGILIQNTLSSSQILHSVIGIGININQTIFKSNPPNPTSFQLETGQSYVLFELQFELFKCIEQWYLQLRSNNHNHIQQNYLDHLYLFEEEAYYQRAADKSIFKGMISGITPTGKLVIEHDGRREMFANKEVEFIR